MLCMQSRLLVLLLWMTFVCVSHHEAITTGTVNNLIKCLPGTESVVLEVKQF